MRSHRRKIKVQNALSLFEHSESRKKPPCALANSFSYASAHSLIQQSLVPPTHTLTSQSHVGFKGEKRAE
jgi:hypothetical protein